MTRDMPRKHVPEGLLLHVKRPGSPMVPFLVLRRIQCGLRQPRRPGQGPNPRTGRLGEEMCSSWLWRQTVTGLYLSCFIMLSIKPLKQKQYQSRGNSRPAAGKTRWLDHGVQKFLFMKQS